MNRRKKGQELDKEFQSFKHFAIQDVFLLEIELNILNMELDKFTSIKNNYKNTKMKWYKHRLLLKKLACLGSAYCRSYVAKLRHRMENAVLHTMKEIRLEGKKRRCFSGITGGKSLIEIMEGIAKHRNLLTRWLSVNEILKDTSFVSLIHMKQIELQNEIKVTISKMKRLWTMQNKIKTLTSASTATAKFILTNANLIFVENKEIIVNEFDTINEDLSKNCKLQDSLVENNDNTNGTSMISRKYDTKVNNYNNGKIYKQRLLQKKQCSNIIKICTSHKKCIKLQLKKINKFYLLDKTYKSIIFNEEVKHTSDVTKNCKKSSNNTKYCTFSKVCYLNDNILQKKNIAKLQINRNTKLFERNDNNDVSMEIETMVKKYAKNDGGTKIADLMSEIESLPSMSISEVIEEQNGFDLNMFLNEQCFNLNKIP